MRRLYSILLYLFAPLLIFRLFIRSIKNISYRRRIAERFSLGKNLPRDVDIWIHAVSLGEVVAATPLIEEFLKAQKIVLVTTMTPSGSQQVLNKFADRVKHQYIPYDLPCCLKKFFKRINACVGIILETEIWPNTIYFADKYGVKLCLVNARISDKAFKQYVKTGNFFKSTLNKFTFIGAQSEVDASRFKKLGAADAKVEVFGNIKFDINYPESNFKHLAILQDAWGKERPVLIAASTHDNEETQLLANLAKLKSALPELVLLIAPRHIERAAYIYDLATNCGFNTGIRSQASTISSASEVIIIDSIGELLDFYQLSDYAFVGGSLVPIGGHNVLEPIFMEVPVFCGPFMQNSQAICKQLQAAEAIVIAQNVEDVFTKILQMAKSPASRQKQIDNAKTVLANNRGCTQKYYEKILQIM